MTFKVLCPQCGMTFQAQDDWVDLEFGYVECGCGGFAMPTEDGDSESDIASPLPVAQDEDFEEDADEADEDEADYD